MAEPAFRQGTPLLLFVHIPKTAGTTVTKILNLNEPGSRSRALGNVFKGSGGINPEVRFRHLETNVPGWDDLRVVTGHIPFGMRDRFPKGREVQGFTFLREPADRTLSHYFGIRKRRRGSDKPGRYTSSALPAEPTLEDMLELGYIHDNLHTRMLSGAPEPFGEVTEQMLEDAKRNLGEEFVFFGITERFDESLVLAKRRLGLKSILYRSSGSSSSAGRVNASRPRGAEVPPDLMQAAERCNRYDIELYRYAQDLFDAAPERDELEFRVELAALGAARDDSGADVRGPTPTDFGGDDEAWKMLVLEKVSLLQHERELAEIKALTCELSEGNAGILTALQGFKTRGKRVVGRDPDAAMTRVVKLLGEIRTELGAERETSGASTGTRPRPRRDTARNAAKPARARPKRDARRRSAKRGGGVAAKPRASKRREDPEGERDGG
jgi:hypothetical protein